MADDLIAQLRETGYEAEADSIVAKQETRAALAAVPAFHADEHAEVAAVVGALDRDIPKWRR